MTWWNPLNSMRVSQLNDNIIISYWMPGDEEHSGLSIFGENKLDESICAIFDHLKNKNEMPRLINVPEPVLRNIHYYDMFKFEEDRGANEYVMSLSQFYPLRNMAPHWKRKVEKSLKQYGVEKIVTQSLDLGIAKDKSILLKALKWRSKNPINDYGTVEEDAMLAKIRDAELLGIDNLCLFADGRLMGFCLFQIPTDKRYVIMRHIKATHPITFGFELIGYMFAKHFVSLGCSYVNLGPDYDLESLRTFMVGINANNFFRKYTITPKGSGGRR